MTYDATQFLAGLFGAVVSKPAAGVEPVRPSAVEVEPVEAKPPAMVVSVEVARPATGWRCRCGSAEWADFPIHDGRSTRRDCARCSRFVAFVRWYGVDRQNSPEASFSARRRETDAIGTH